MITSARSPVVLRIAVKDAELSYRYWPQERPSAAIVHFHGIESHSRWYTDWGAALHSRGYAVYCADRVGSGESSGTRGHIDSWRTWVDHAAAIVRQVKREHPGLPVFAAGSCWGAKVALQVAQRLDCGGVDGLVLLAPALRLRIGFRWQEALQIGLSSIVTPKRRFAIPIPDEEMFTPRIEGAEFIRRDPLRLRQATARFLVETRKLDRANERVLSALGAPALVLLAGDDQIVDTPTVGRRLREVDGMKIRIFPGYPHSMEFAPTSEALAEEIHRWATDRKLGRIV